MRERPRQRRQSLSRPATTQFIPHVPQDSPRSDLRNVFYSPASSLQRRTRSGRCSCCAAPSHIHRLRLSLCGCVVMSLCGSVVVWLRATPTGSSCRFPHGFPQHHRHVFTPRSDCGCGPSPYAPATPPPYLSTSHPPSRTQKRDGEAETPPSPNCVCSCSTPYRSACHHKVISIPG